MAEKRKVVKDKKMKIAVYVHGGLVKWALCNDKSLKKVDLVIIDGDTSEDDRDCVDVSFTDEIGLAYVRSEKLTVSTKFFKQNEDNL